ncbi:MAG: hypothetical protein RLZZ172_2287 [Bacteroidota bacterium]|jgi:hypothetical protein
MKKIIKLLFLSLAGIVTIFSFSKKEKTNAEQDAVRLPEFNESAIVEDYEIAAYHNQA